MVSRLSLLKLIDHSIVDLRTLTTM